MNSKIDKALLIVDLQNDFMPKGSLGVKEGDKIVPIINDLVDQFDLIVASQDWHPERHVSFAKTHGKAIGEKVDVDGVVHELWPVHCVENTKGAALVKELKTEKIRAMFKKGTDLNIDSYSAFFDNGHKHATGLDDFFKEWGVKTLYLVGLTTDFCVKFTALDALDLGYEVVIIRDGCKPVFEEEKTLKELQMKGAKVVFSQDL